MSERLDVNYNLLSSSVEERLTRAIFPVVTVGSIQQHLQYGCSKRAQLEPVGLPILRMSNMQPDGWDFTELKYVQLTDREKSAWLLKQGDILFNRTNSKELVGKCEVFGEPGEWVFASYLMRLTVNPGRAAPAFVAAFLSGPTGRAQIERDSRQIIGMTNINAEEIRALRIPLPDDMATQAALLADLDAARAARDAGLAKAETVLAGLDAFILGELGITLLPLPDHTRPFAVTRAVLASGGKLFPDYYNPERQHAVAALHAVGADALASAVDFIRTHRMSVGGEFYVGLANVSSNTGEYIEATEDVEGTIAVFGAGDVLFAKLRPYLNKVWVADRSGVCSPEFHVLRLRPVSRIKSADYLAAVLRFMTTLAQTRHMMTGNTHPRLAPEDVAALVIPVPSTNQQLTIAAEVDRRRAEARRLRSEARAGWAKARQAFEDALLGPSA